ncbi:MAG: pilus assembly protein PilM [Chloroflexota bacterium]
MAEQKEEVKSQSVMSLDLGTAIRKLLKILKRALPRFVSGKIVTLDINQTGIRIMETRGGMVRSWADVSFEPEEMEQMAKGGKATLGAKVRQLMDSSGIKAKNVIVSISGMYTISRLIPMSNLPPAPTLEESVHELAQEIMPVPTEGLYVFWQVVGTNEGEQQVFILGVPRDVMDDNVRALKSVGLNPQVVELKTMALARAVNKEQALILNIEPTSFDIIMAVQGVPKIMHSLAWRQDSRNIGDAIEYLAANLEMTVDFYNSHHLDVPFDMTNPLYITGQMSVEPELMEKLQTRLGFNVEQLTPPLECPAFFPISQYAVNIGLAMRREMPVLNSDGGAGFFPLDVNLLPQTYRPWRPKANQLFYAGILVSAVALVFPLMQISGEEIRKTTNLELKNNYLDNQLQLKMMEIQKREPLQKAISEYNSIVTRDVSFNEDIKVIINEAEKVGAKVSSISHGGGEINISCQAENYLSFRAYLTALEESGRFSTPIPPPEGYPYTRGGPIKLEPQISE